MRLKRSATAETNCYATQPYVLDRRGRKIWKWDSFLSDALRPQDQRQRDVWAIAEMLDERRRQDKITRAAVEARQRILMAQIDGSRKR